MIDQNLVEKFESIGLSHQRSKESLKNSTLSKNLIQVIDVAKAGNNWPVSSSVGNLLYHIASKIKSQILHYIPFITEYVCDGRINSEIQLNAGLDFLMCHPDSDAESLSSNEFEAACGVGVFVTPEQIEQSVEIIFEKFRTQLVEQRYQFPIGQLMNDARKALPWADGRAIKAEIELQRFYLLGAQTDEDRLASSQKKKGTVLSSKPKRELESATSFADLIKNKFHQHAPGDNYKTEGYVVTPTTLKHMAEHLKRTGGLVRTRFPPEPNGILHLGHAKAININFGYAAAHNGLCFLRYDDTNPEKEEEKFFIGIREMVEWLGYTPYAITHSSDYFQQLYEWAKVLIKRDLAYVCHQSVEDMRGFNSVASPWRSRPISESLKLFDDMSKGKFDEGEAVLRLKITLEEGKIDPVAYRIKYAAHHRTGNQWCVYPTYDYTHCLCDSIEDISHSLCTKEFQCRRSSYYWLCNALDVYCPVQWEYGRLNISYTVVSKRKIGKLISNGICEDWDDPRLYTLTALRRRGFPKEAINNFCAQMGVTGAQMTVDPVMIESCVRSFLNTHACRTMVVIEPLKVKIINRPSSTTYVNIPDFPDQPAVANHNVSLSDIIFIDRSDFRAQLDNDFRRLAPEQPVGLRHAGIVISLERIVAHNSNGDVSEIEVSCLLTSDDNCRKPKAFIHWVSQPIDVEVRLYDRLFLHRDPDEAEGGFLSDINPESLKIVKNAKADRYLSSANGFDGKFQFERVGYFALDKDSSETSLVFNRTVSLKEDVKKHSGLS